MTSACFNFTGRRIGVLSFGAIGQRVADRLAGFCVTVAYSARTPKETRPELFLAAPGELAAWADDLIVAVFGGAETRHLVDDGGPGGRIVVDVRARFDRPGTLFHDDPPLGRAEGTLAERGADGRHRASAAG